MSKVNLDNGFTFADDRNSPDRRLDPPHVGLHLRRPRAKWAVQGSNLRP